MAAPYRPIAARPPPHHVSGGAWSYLRTTFFATPLNALLTVLSLWLIWLLASGIISWVFINAVFTGSDRAACADSSGMCWPFVWAKLGQWFYGRYPLAERWRVDLYLLLLAAGTVYLLIPRAPRKRMVSLWLAIAAPVLAYVLLLGGVAGLAVVETQLWGGVMLTLVIAITGNLVSLPLAVALALGRRADKLPIIRLLCVCFIEFVRGVPLITFLFMASVMLPLFLPEGATIDKLARALVAVTLFQAAYLAEVVRGGLQALAHGQEEGAQALGLSYWPTMRLIVLPQSLKIAIPGIMNSYIALLKDTTLVLIIGLFDILGMVQLTTKDPNWIAPTTVTSGYFIVALFFWVCCFLMSRYSRSLERKLETSR